MPTMERGKPRHAIGNQRLRQPCRDPFGQPLLDEQRSDFVDAEVTLLAFALAEDFQQHRPFALHQHGIVPVRRVAVALEIGRHEGVDLLGRQPALDAAGGILAVLAEAREPGDFVLMNLRIDVENARTGAVLVERAIAQFVEHRAGGRALQHAQRPEAVGNDGDHPGLQPHIHFAHEPVSPLASPDHFGEFRKRHDVAADIAVGDQRAQKRAGIVG